MPSSHPTVGGVQGPACGSLRSHAAHTLREAGRTPRTGPRRRRDRRRRDHDGGSGRAGQEPGRPGRDAPVGHVLSDAPQRRPPSRLSRPRLGPQVDPALLAVGADDAVLILERAGPSRRRPPCRPRHAVRSSGWAQPGARRACRRNPVGRHRGCGAARRSTGPRRSRRPTATGPTWVWASPPLSRASTSARVACASRRSVMSWAMETAPTTRPERRRPGGCRARPGSACRPCAAPRSGDDRPGRRRARSS